MIAVIGKQSRRFIASGAKPCVLGGVHFEDHPGIDQESDGDVIFGSICEAFATLIPADQVNHVIHDLYEGHGITDSQEYVKAICALCDDQIEHVAITVEAKEPRLSHYLEQMRENIASALKIKSRQVGITVIAGAGLTEVGCGEGVTAIAVLSLTPAAH